MNKKGQAAMEFLMTYGWAILAVFIVLGVLAVYFGNIPVTNTVELTGELAQEMCESNNLSYFAPSALKSSRCFKIDGNILTKYRYTLHNNKYYLQKE